MSASQITQFAEMSLKGAKRLHGEIETILYYLQVPALARRSAGCRLAQIPSLVDTVSHELKMESVTVEGPEGLEKGRLSLSERGVELVLREILDNAKKFHPQQKPTVEVSLSAWESKGVCIRIADDGLTLSPEQRAQAWAPYYQGEKNFTGEVAGMGLGLTTVALVTWQVGGTCRLYNRPQKPGVVVELFVPWEPSP